MTMRELMDVLKSATPEERLEFSEWWDGLPLPRTPGTLSHLFGLMPDRIRPPVQVTVPNSTNAEPY